MRSRGNGRKLAILKGMAAFKVGPRVKILTNNPSLARWTLDGTFGKHKKQLLFLTKQIIIYQTCAGQGRKLVSAQNVASQVKTTPARNVAIRLTG